MTDFATNEAAKASEQREKQAVAEAQAELQRQISEANRKPDMWAGDKVEVDPASHVVIVFVVIAIFVVLFAIFGT